MNLQLLKTSRALLAALAVLAGQALAAPPPPAAATPDCSVQIKPGPHPNAQSLAQDAAKSNPCTLVPGLTPKSLASVWSALLSSNKTGGKRFDTPPPSGLPAGRVLLDSTGLVFNLQAVASEGVVALQVSASGSPAPLFSLANPTQAVLVLPAERLRPGGAYEWRLSTRKANYKAAFEVLDADEAATVRAQLAALAAADLSPQLRQLYLAAIYDDAELYAARDQVLEQIRRQVAP